MAGGDRPILQKGAQITISGGNGSGGYSYLPWVDCICAGVPCQDVSVAGKRAGLKGERTGLFYEFARILQELRPAWFVFENVPGLLNSNGGRDFAEVLRVLMVECGYGVSWRVLDGRFFNCAQRRERVFIVGRFGKPCPAEILFEPAGVRLDSASRRETGQDIAGTLGGSAQSGGFRTTDLDNQGAFIAEARYARNGRGGPSELSPPLKAENGRTGKGDGTPLVFQPRYFTRTNKTGGKPAGVSMPLEAGKRNGDSQAMVCAAPDAERMGISAIAPKGLDSARYRSLGNAVMPNVSNWIAWRIRRVLEAEKP